MKRYLVFMSGRTCTGKSTLLQKIRERANLPFKLYVNIAAEYTTRPLRPDEIGVPYSTSGVISTTDEELEEYRSKGDVVIESSFQVHGGDIWTYAIVNNETLFPPLPEDTSYEGILTVVPTSIYSAIKGVEWCREYNLSHINDRIDYVITYLYADNDIVLRRTIGRDLTYDCVEERIRESIRRYDTTIDPTYDPDGKGMNVEYELCKIIRTMHSIFNDEYDEITENSPISTRSLCKKCRRKIETLMKTHKIIILINNGEFTMQELFDEFIDQLYSYIH